MTVHKSLRGPGIHALLVLGVLLGALVPVAHARMDDVELPTAYGRFPEGLYALRDPDLFQHNVGLLTLQVTNIGLIGNPFIEDFSAGWRGGEYLFFSGLWIGAIGSDSEPHVSTASPIELRPDLDPLWTIYESFEGIKNGVRLGEADPEGADDDSDGLFDEDFHNGLDDDGDGLIDEDYAAVGQQMLSCVYRDDTPEAVSQVSDHFPLGLMIRQRSFQWSTTGINEFVGFDFEVVNTGDQRLKEVYLAFFSDSDAGPRTAERYWTDDLVSWAAIDTTVVDLEQTPSCQRIDLSIDTAFMWDAPDNGTSVTGGDVPGVFGSLFLGHTTDDTGVRAPQNVGLTTVTWFSSSGQNSDPQNDDERYQLLASARKPLRGANKPDDYRYVIGAGPFAQLNPGESLNFQTAYVIGEGQDGYRANAVNAQRVFDGIFIDADMDPNTGLDGKERCLRVLQQGEEVVWDDPCDTLITTVRHRLQTCLWVDDDCNACTGIDGKETLIEWVGTTAPPPPAMNTDPGLDPLINPDLKAFVSPAGDRYVVVQWDNSSELAQDPITGTNLFEGYRVWRVDNWQRPEGSIGPSPEEWMKVAEFRKDPQGAKEQGARSLREAFNPGDVEPIDFTDTDPPEPVYPIGRYQYIDEAGVINGKLYFYAVTAFGVVERVNPLTGRRERVELGGQPSAVEAEAVLPRWDATGGCDDVRVVPNPYRGTAAWDLVPSERDPTGTKLAFRNLPDERATIRIYTLAGDLVQEVEHDGRTGDGTYFWNLVSRNGQDITSGVYLFSVQYSGGTCRGRFAVIR